MKKTFFVLIFLVSNFINAQEGEVKATIEEFFVAFHAKDTVKLHTVCSDRIILQSIQENTASSKLTYESSAEFYKSIAAIPTTITFQEKLLSYSIQIDGAMAHVWTPYEFYVNGKLSHSGVNSFTLFKENNGWKIIYCIDTRRKSL